MGFQNYVTYREYGAEYINGAKDALKQWDANKDGKTSVDELFDYDSRLMDSIFKGNSELTKKAHEISDAQKEVYKKYAGDDGILDEYEYVRALNSDENSVLLNAYWELSDMMDAKKGKDDDISMGIYDYDNDGSTSAMEILLSRMERNSGLFEDKASRLEANEIAKEQAKILKRYEGDDGVLSSDEYAQAMRSREYQKTMDRLLDIEY